MIFTINKIKFSYWNHQTLKNHSKCIFGVVSFFVFPCSKGHSVRVYLDIIQITLVGTLLATIAYKVTLSATNDDNALKNL